MYTAIFLACTLLANMGNWTSSEISSAQAAIRLFDPTLLRRISNAA
jgi:hypothetical protein